MATKKELEKRIAALEAPVKGLTPKPAPLAIGTRVTIQGRIISHDPHDRLCEYEVEMDDGGSEWFSRDAITVVP